MKLIEDWKRVLKRAWSVKFNIAALIFGAGEVVVSMVHPTSIPSGAFAAVSALLSVGAVITRALAQPEDIRAIAEQVAEEIRHDAKR